MFSLVVAVVLGATGSVAADVQTRAGYDTNIFFGSAQDLADPNLFGPARDAFASVHPALEGALQAGRLRLAGQYDLSYTQYGQYAHGYFRIHRLGLSEELRLGPATLGLFELADDYAISAFRSDHMQRALGGASAGALVGRWELGLRLEGGLRHFPDREIGYRVVENDPTLGAAVLARWSRGPLELDAVTRGERRGSNAPALAGDTEQLTVDGLFTRGAVDVGAGLDARRLSLPDFPVSDTALGREDVRYGVHGALQWHLGPVTVGADLGYERNFSNYALAEFKRLVAGLELGFRWSWSEPPPPAATPLAERPGRYRLLANLPGARQVAVVGSFQGWQAPGIPMTEIAPGQFAVELDLPPGRHRYQLIVDGVRTAPPDADGYEPDGMGGLDGVLVVPGASESGVAR